MSFGSSWVAWPDRDFALVKEHRRQRLEGWGNQAARRRAEFTERIPSIAAQVASDVSAAVAAALQASQSAASTASLVDIAISSQPINNLDVGAPAYGTTTIVPSSGHASVTPTFALAKHVGQYEDLDLVLVSPATCSSLCPAGDMSSVAASVEAYRVLGEAASTACSVRATPNRTGDLHAGAASITTAVEPGYDCLAHAPPTTCSCLCPAGNTSSGATSSMTCEGDQKLAGLTRDSNIHLVAQHLCSVPIRTPAIVGVVVCVLPMVTPDEGIAMIAKAPARCATLGPRPVVSFVNLGTNSGAAIEHSFITGLSAMSLASAALGVQGGKIVNMYEVALPLKLLELTMFETKEHIISYDTSMNQLQAKFSSKCLGLDCATTSSISSLQWDPVKQKGALDAYVKNLTEDSTVSYNHNQKRRYASNQKYFPWLIQLSCSSENVIAKNPCPGIWVELLQYLFDSVGIFIRQYEDSLVVGAPIYIAICVERVAFEDLLVGSSAVQSNFQWQYPEPYIPCPSTHQKQFSGLHSVFLIATGHSLLLFPWDPGAQLASIWYTLCPQGNEFISNSEFMKWLASSLKLCEPWASWEQWQCYMSYYKTNHCKSMYILLTVGSAMAIISPTILEYLVQSCYAGQACLSDSASLCWKIAWYNTSEQGAMDCLDSRGSLILSSGYHVEKDGDKAGSTIPWDPGGSVWWRLGGKPPFKEGGMLAYYTCTWARHGGMLATWTGPAHLLHTNLLQIRSSELREGLARNWTASAFLLLSSSSSRSLSSSYVSSRTL